MFAEDEAAKEALTGVGVDVGEEVSLATRLSELIGVLIIIGSFTVKVPIIVNVLKYRSSKGLSLTSLYAQCVSLAAYTIYNVLRGTPVSAWAENLSVLVQNVILVCLVWYYSRAAVSEMVAATGGLAAMAAAMSALEEDQHWMLPLTATVVGLSGLLPQIIENHRNGHTGALSLISQTLNVLGVVARIFTTLQLAKDAAMLISLSANFGTAGA
ncbi:Mannose-P-dolichol utilization defect 1 protein-like 1 [Hondaea fermentalgiana]|uniref:Mannose-P-dolichol utilization defect 1 protein-like 1 n=1 Tax=Hondaea fermentalgiana TaxID=2315210 RepID=A0A2R5GRR6_9STRA|nr:Mannose-P-dolichol utilization defect 1 protein-like 1 [Hondaea fermentalgiana]|eukprot:GBG31333.1 Mannose-P-dolichol utilization defect 1 protein-like 1 [Hondaea fermentalgiana]